MKNGPRWICAMLVATAAPYAASQSVQVAPSPATTVDTVYVDYDAGHAFCAAPQVRLEPIPPEVQALYAPAIASVVVEFSTGPVCAADAPHGTRVTLGRLPAAKYAVQVFESQTAGEAVVAVMTAVAPLTVVDSVAARKPMDDYAGHWSTDRAGEGVTVAQFGGRMFLTWLTYGDAGQATWYVVSKADYQPGAPAGRFVGQIYATFGTPVLPGTVGAFAGLAPVGEARFIERSADRARVELFFGASAEPVVRELTRMRF
jgi:hypothetical protein